MNARLGLASLLACAAPFAAAQDHAASSHASHAADDHAHHAAPAPATPQAHAHPHPPAEAAPPRVPIPALTDADRAAAFPALQVSHTHAAAPVHYLRVDRLEGWNRDAGSGQAWELDGWYGGDLHRLRLRSEGERGGGRTHEADAEVLYGRAVSPWWELVAGVRQDFLPGVAQTRAAFGIQGLAPYKFEVSATAYFGGGSRAALRLEGEYTLLLSARWILQPRVEANLSARDDRRRGAGGGLDSASAGLRLRYEVNRRFAPYVGWEQVRSFGDAADFRRAEDDPVRESRFVAGLRFWF